MQYLQNLRKEKIIACICLVLSCVGLFVSAISIVGALLALAIMLKECTDISAVDFLLAFFGCFIPAVGVIGVLLTLQEWAITMSSNEPALSVAPFLRQE